MKSESQTTGLRYWMLRVVDECDRAAAGFNADPVHDLRVSLRRCRSMADGLMAIDPDPDWKAMKKAGRALFQRLGALRDVQIMMDWIEKLEPKISKMDAERPVAASADDQDQAEHLLTPVGTDSPRHRDSAAHALLGILRHRETEQKREARAALDEFDRKQWRQWSRSLPQRAAHVRPGSVVFKHLALERWTAARELHRRAMRSRSKVSLHATRIGLKRFRYIVENFLPVEHKLWSNDLKHMQDLLGEIHDLDVLWTTALQSRVFPSSDSRLRWHHVIQEERKQRFDAYREKMVGSHSLWENWRAALPQGKQIPEIASRRMKLWARALDPDFAHSERVARLSLQLYDGLIRAGLFGFPSRNGSAKNGASATRENSDLRFSLYAAALLHDVGKSKGNKNHHKETLVLIRRHPVPLGWNQRDIQLAAIVARFHCGSLPRRGHKALRDLLPQEQSSVIRLTAILRLANALDAAHDGHIRQISVEGVSHPAGRANGFARKPGRNEALVVSAEGYSPSSAIARVVAAERHLLETVLRRPVVVRPARVRAPA